MELVREETVLGSGARVYVQIVNSANEDRVISDARERAQSLADANFKDIIVLRDVAPNFDREEVDKLRRGMADSLRGLPVPAVALLQVMEFEAWLLTMTDFYSRIDGRLSERAIEQHIGYVPNCDNCQSIDRPSEVQKQILSLADIDDIKSQDTVARVLDAFEMNVFIRDRVAPVPDLGDLVNRVEAVKAQHAPDT